MSINERNSLTEWINGFKLANPTVWIYKIPDMFPTKGTRFSLERPFDLEIVQDSEFNAIEAKAVKKSKFFAKDKLKDHQLENLEKVEYNGCKSYLLIFNLDIDPYEAYLIRLQNYKDLALINLDKKSVKLVDIKEKSIVYIRIRLKEDKKYIYIREVEPFLNI